MGRTSNQAAPYVNAGNTANDFRKLLKQNPSITMEGKCLDFVRQARVLKWIFKDKEVKFFFAHLGFQKRGEAPNHSGFNKIWDDRLTGGTGVITKKRTNISAYATNAKEL